MESFAKIQLVEDSKILGAKNLTQELDKTKFDLELSSELKRQENLAKYQKEGKKTPIPPPHSSSAPLKNKEISKLYDETKEDYLQTAMTINKTDLDAAVENADEKSKGIITEVINPTPGLKVDGTLNLEEQFEHKSNDLERTFDLSNQLQDRLDNILLLMKQNNRLFNETSIEQIPNDPLNNEKTEIKAEDIYIDDNYTDNFQFFPALSTDDRKDFELKITGSDLIVYKSPLLTTGKVSRKQLKVTPNKILDDLNEKIEDFQTQSG